MAKICLRINTKDLVHQAGNPLLKILVGCKTGLDLTIPGFVIMGSH